MFSRGQIAKPMIWVFRGAACGSDELNNTIRHIGMFNACWFGGQSSIAG